MAQTNYDFSVSFDSGDTVSGTFTTGAEIGSTGFYTITGFSNVMIDGVSGGPATVIVGASYSPTAQAYGSGFGGGNGQATTSFELLSSSHLNSALNYGYDLSFKYMNPSVQARIWYCSDTLGCPYFGGGGSQNGSSSTQGTFSAGYSGAPEIDGSLAPKVGFLLGCLFLMFGRKKQNSESMMIA